MIDSADVCSSNHFLYPPEQTTQAPKASMRRGPTDGSPGGGVPSGPATRRWRSKGQATVAGPTRAPSWRRGGHWGRGQRPQRGGTRPTTNKWEERIFFKVRGVKWNTQKTKSVSSENLRLFGERERERERENTKEYIQGE